MTVRKSILELCLSALFSASICLAADLQTAEDDFRTWTLGKRSIQGRYVGVIDDGAVIKNDKGRLVELPIGKLDREDLLYLKDRGVNIQLPEEPAEAEEQAPQKQAETEEGLKDLLTVSIEESHPTQIKLGKGGKTFFMSLSEVKNGSVTISTDSRDTEGRLADLEGVTSVDDLSDLAGYDYGNTSLKLGSSDCTIVRNKNGEYAFIEVIGINEPRGIVCLSYDCSFGGSKEENPAPKKAPAKKAARKVPNAAEIVDNSLPKVDDKESGRQQWSSNLVDPSGSFQIEMDNGKEYDYSTGDRDYRSPFCILPNEKGYVVFCISQKQKGNDSFAVTTMSDLEDGNIDVSTLDFSKDRCILVPGDAVVFRNSKGVYSTISFKSIDDTEENLRRHYGVGTGEFLFNCYWGEDLGINEN